MRNQYPGTCYRCGEWCAAGDGHFERIGSRFRVQHATCAIRCRGVPDPEREARRVAKDAHLAKQTGKRAQQARRRIRDRLGIEPGSGYFEPGTLPPPPSDQSGGMDPV